MIKQLAFLLIALFSVNAYAQSDSTKQDLSPKERRAIKKEEKAAAEEAAKVETMALVKSRRFIVKASQVYGGMGATFNVSPTTNFILVDSANSTVQLSFTGLVGWNGVGGVTLDGNIIDYNLDEGKEGRGMTLTFRIEGSFSRGRVVMNISPTGGVSATIYGDFGDQINFDGVIEPITSDNHFKGIRNN